MFVILDGFEAIVVDDIASFTVGDGNSDYAIDIGRPKRSLRFGSKVDILTNEFLVDVPSQGSRKQAGFGESY